MADATLPTGAITDALISLHETGCGCGKGYHPPSRSDMARLKIALEAAQPAIRAAERKCLRLRFEREVSRLAGQELAVAATVLRSFADVFGDDMPGGES